MTGMTKKVKKKIDSSLSFDMGDDGDGDGADEAFAAKKKADRLRSEKVHRAFLWLPGSKKFYSQPHC